MKLVKFFRSILVFWVATGAVAAFADETCDERIITNTTINENITVIGKDCRINGVTVNGNVTVVGAEKFSMQNSEIKGDLTVRESNNVMLGDVDVSGFNIAATGNTQVDMSFVEAKKISVTGNGLAYVVWNGASTFDCSGNIRLVAEGNVGPNARKCFTLNF